MRTTLSIVLVTGLLSLTACIKTGVGAHSASTGSLIPAAENGPYVVVGHLEHRDHLVTVKAGDQGTVYSVTNKKDGKILYDNLTAEQLKARSPEVHDFIEAAEAGQAGLGLRDLAVK